MTAAMERPDSSTWQRGDANACAVCVRLHVNHDSWKGRRTGAAAAPIALAGTVTNAALGVEKHAIDQVTARGQRRVWGWHGSSPHSHAPRSGELQWRQGLDCHGTRLLRLPARRCRVQAAALQCSAGMLDPSLAVSQTGCPNLRQTVQTNPLAIGTCHRALLWHARRRVKGRRLSVLAVMRQPGWIRMPDHAVHLHLGCRVSAGGGYQRSM